jgi:regulator of sigma E protease
MTSLLAFIFLIGILVFIHELGHFMAARSVGVRVEKFYIGFNLFGYGWK